MVSRAVGVVDETEQVKKEGNTRCFQVEGVEDGGQRWSVEAAATAVVCGGTSGSCQSPVASTKGGQNREGDREERIGVGFRQHN